MFCQGPTPMFSYHLNIIIAAYLWPTLPLALSKYVDTTFCMLFQQTIHSSAATWSIILLLMIYNCLNRCMPQTAIITWYIQHNVHNFNLVKSLTTCGFGKVNTISVLSWTDASMTFALLFWGGCPFPFWLLFWLSFMWWILSSSPGLRIEHFFITAPASSCILCCKHT